MAEQGMRSLAVAVLILIGTAVLAAMSHMNIVQSVAAIETAQANGPLNVLSLERMADR